MTEAPQADRVAVLLRTDSDVPKLRHSLAQLEGGAAYDLFILAHEEPGWEMDFGHVPKIAFARQDLVELGYPANRAGFLQHCADAVFAIVQARLPGYDWYVFVDRDVLIRPSSPGYFDRLATALRARPPGELEAAAPIVRGTSPEWFWHATTARRYNPVMSACTPVVALSARALSHLVSERLKEVTPQPGSVPLEDSVYPLELIFVDAFIASALMSAGLAMMDLEALLPGSYTLGGFNRQVGRTMGGERLDAPPALAHPVLDDGALLEERFSESTRTEALDQFLSDVRARIWPMAEGVYREFQDRLIAPPFAIERRAPARVAVLLRTHVDNDTVRGLLAALREGTGYDLFVLAHEEPGREMDFAPTPKISHSMQTFRDLGFEVEQPYFLLHCADLLFAFAQARAPGYDWYVLVENDLLIRPDAAGYFDRLAARLADHPPGTLDLVVPKLMFSNPGWMWHRAAARRYPRVLSSFFPLVAMSGRAVPYLFGERVSECDEARAAGVKLSPSGEPSNIIFCEAFVPSALWAGGYRITDLNHLSPGSYSTHEFNFGPPRLLSEERTDAPGALAHPVLHDRDFLEKHMIFSWRTGALDGFISALRRPEWPSIPVPLLREFEQKAAELAARDREGRAG